MMRTDFKHLVKSFGELWYDSIKPDERELAGVKRIYKDY